LLERPKSGAQIDAIFLDFSKAYDKVPYNRLFLKLPHYGIQGTLLEWIKDFLTNRIQQVVINNINSESAKVLSAVCTSGLCPRAPFVFV